MVAALGGPRDFVERMDTHLQPAPIVREIMAPASGAIAAIDTRGIGMAVVALGGGRRLPTDKIDHAVGFDRLLGLGATVDAQTPLAVIHARDEASADDATARLIAAYKFGDSAESHPLIADHVDPPKA
jgi:thymidine phosphorylase